MLDDSPALRDSQAFAVTQTEIEGMRFSQGSERAENRRGIRINVDQGVCGYLATTRSSAASP